MLSEIFEDAYISNEIHEGNILHISDQASIICEAMPDIGCIRFISFMNLEGIIIKNPVRLENSLNRRLLYVKFEFD